MAWAMVPKKAVIVQGSPRVYDLLMPDAVLSAKSAGRAFSSRTRRSIRWG